MKVLLLFISLLSQFMLTAQVKHLKVEANHSTLAFDISIAGFTSVSGTFSDYSLEMDWDPDSLELSWIRSTIEVESINTGIAGRDEHLRTADFFDVEQYPTIDFQSDSIVQKDFSNYLAYGTLSMHGHSQAFVLPFQIVKVDGNTVGIRSRCSLNRLDYGVASDFKHDAMPDFLAELIDVRIDFWTKKRKVE